MLNTPSTIPPLFWLDSPFMHLVEMYDKGTGHHALLLQSTQGLGEEYLLNNLAQRLLCQNLAQYGGTLLQADDLSADTQAIVPACGTCHSCQLFMANNHPDLHIIAPERGKSSIGVDAIRSLNDVLFTYANQGGAKIIQINKLELLTEAAANALLKMLEEPPANSYFLLNTFEPSEILPTIRSRCLTYLLNRPARTESIQWLKQAIPDKPQSAYQTALKLTYDAPLAALAMLDDTHWALRNSLLNELSHALNHNQLFSLLGTFKGKDSGGDIIVKLDFLVSVLLDVVKFQQLVVAENSLGTQSLAGEIRNPINAHFDALTNEDVLPLIEHLNQSLTAISSDYGFIVLQNLLKLRSQLIHNSALNQELLIADFLMKWQNRTLQPSSFGFSSLG